MPSKRPVPACAFSAAFTSSRDTSRFRMHTTSTTEPSGTGTRIEMPSILPSSSGITSPIAFAAPVDVGITDTAAERARRRSLCGASRIIWSFV